MVDPGQVPREPGEGLTDWRLRALEDAVKAQQAEIAGLRRILLGFAISVSGGSVIFALGVSNLS